MLHRVGQRLIRRGQDGQHLPLLAAMAVAIGFQQIVKAQLEDRLIDRGETLRGAAREDIAAEQGPRHQRGAGALHRCQQAQPVRQRFRQLDRGRAALVRRRLGQQQARFEIRQPSRHYQVIGGDLQSQATLRGDEGEVLVGQFEDRDAREVDLLLARQGEQKVDRAFIPVEVEDEAGFAHPQAPPVTASTKRISALAARRSATQRMSPSQLRAEKGAGTAPSGSSCHRVRAGRAAGRGSRQQPDCHPSPSGERQQIENAEDGVGCSDDYRVSRNEPRLGTSPTSESREDRIANIGHRPGEPPRSCPAGSASAARNSPAPVSRSRTKRHAWMIGNNPCRRVDVFERIEADPPARSAVSSPNERREPRRTRAGLLRTPPADPIAPRSSRR